MTSNPTAVYDHGNIKCSPVSSDGLESRHDRFYITQASEISLAGFIVNYNTTTATHHAHPGSAFLAPTNSVTYYGSVVDVVAADVNTQIVDPVQATQQFFRLFMVPGMGHCSGGPGTDQFDFLTALEHWVERGAAPDKIIASHRTGGVVDRTRPLCPHPQVARYSGTGNVNDASSFACIGGAL